MWRCPLIPWCTFMSTTGHSSYTSGRVVLSSFHIGFMKSCCKPAWIPQAKHCQQMPVIIPYHTIIYHQYWCYELLTTTINCCIQEQSSHLWDATGISWVPRVQEEAPSKAKPSWRILGCASPSKWTQCEGYIEIQALKAQQPQHATTEICCRK